LMGGPGSRRRLQTPGAGSARRLLHGRTLHQRGGQNTHHQRHKGIFSGGEEGVEQIPPQEFEAVAETLDPHQKDKEQDKQSSGLSHRTRPCCSVPRWQGVLHRMSQNLSASLCNGSLFYFKGDEPEGLPALHLDDYGIAGLQLSQPGTQTCKAADLMAIDGVDHIAW